MPPPSLKPTNKNMEDCRNEAKKGDGFRHEEEQPWGSYIDIMTGDDFVVRMLTIKVGARTSLHRHAHRSEMWQCVAGKPKVMICDSPDKIASVPFVGFAPGEATRVRVNHVHRIDNRNGHEDAKIIEIQFGKCDNNDVERFLDDYGRPTVDIPKPVLHTAKNDANAKELTASGPVVVKFTASWCAPCKTIAPKFHEIAKTETDVRFVEVDVDVCGEFILEHSVDSMPTFVAMFNGKEINRFSGAIAMNIQTLVDEVKAKADNQAKLG